METGLERVQRNPELLSSLGRIGIVVNQAVATSSFEPAVEVIYDAVKKSHGSTVTCVFGPQHGFYQTEQDNMFETPDLTFKFSDAVSLPLYSLYSKTREPTEEQLNSLDTLVVDLLDIGTRIYTYMYTLSLCLRAAAKFHKRVIVLDRPNPLGLAYKDPATSVWKRVEGNLLDPKRFSSFVGWYPIPCRHGLTLGELCKLWVKWDGLQVDYRVITVSGLKRSMTLPELAAYFSSRWTLPSPNMPSWYSALFFVPFVMLEGTNVSEGRGSTLPFQIVGAPGMDAAGLWKYLQDSASTEPHSSIANVQCTVHHFRPTFNKQQGKICTGLFFHYLLNDPSNEPNLFSIGIRFIYYCITRSPDWFQWKSPGYEYNYDTLPILLILGSDRWQEVLPANIAPISPSELAVRDLKLDALLRSAHVEAQQFAEDAQAIFLYD